MKCSQEAIKDIEGTAQELLRTGKGIFAADESGSSIQGRFESNGIENTKNNRNSFRELMFKATGVERFISGIILNRETFAERSTSGETFADILISKGIMPGIKLDLGLEKHGPGETISTGIETLKAELRSGQYAKAKFAKWRSAYLISSTTPSTKCIDDNSKVLAAYAKECQLHCILPIVEPEIVWSGDYSIELASYWTKTVISNLIYHLNLQHVHIPGVIIKTGFVSSGKNASNQASSNEIAHATLLALASSVPAAIPGIVFLSGGHSPDEASSLLRSVVDAHRVKTWKLTYSYGRALSDPVLAAWKGDSKNLAAASKVFADMVKRNSNAVLNHRSQN